MVFAYAIINRDGNTHHLYIDRTRLTTTIEEHLKGLDFRDYTSITQDITTFSNQGKRIWISPMSSFAIYDAVTNKVIKLFKLYS